MHVFLSTFNIIGEKFVANNFLCKYVIKQLNPPCLYTQFSGIQEMNLRTLMERHVITFLKQLMNQLYQPAWTILVKLGEINMTPLIILSKTQSLLQGKKFALSSTSIVTVCVFVRRLFLFYPFYFDFHSARNIFDVSSGFYLWNINKTTA